MSHYNDGGRFEAELQDLTDRSDNQEFEAFYRETSARAQGYVRCLCRNATEAEDIVHDGYVTALKQWDTYTGQGSRRAWLTGILRNTFFSWRRRRILRQVISLGLAGEIADRHVAADERDRPLWEAVEGLEKNQREIVYLRFAGGLSYAEMAEVLKIPDGTVRSRLHRALKELKERLEHDQ